MLPRWSKRKYQSIAGLGSNLAVCRTVTVWWFWLLLRTLELFLWILKSKKYALSPYIYFDVLQNCSIGKREDPQSIHVKDIRLWNRLSDLDDLRHSIHGAEETRPDTRLPQSRAGGQEQCWRRSLEHLGRSSRLKKLNNAEKVTSHPRIAHGQRYPMPCLEW